MYRESPVDAFRAGAKKVLKNSRIGRFMYPFLQRIWRSYAIPARIRRLHRCGYDVLRDMHGLLVSNGVPYYCDCGTLLGFIRDDGFIKHDDDIDICIMPDSMPLSRVLKIFLDGGYGFVHGFDFHGRFIEFTVKDRRGVTIDVFQHTWCEDDRRFLQEIFLRWYPDRHYPNERCNTALKFRLRGPDGLKLYVVKGVEVYIPTNYEEVLDSEYGPWRNPDPNFKSEQLRYEELPEFAVRLTQEEALKA